MSERAVRISAVASFVAMWVTSPVAAEAAEQMSQRPVSVDSVTISLPVYVTSVVATAIFTWKVGQYDKKQAIKHIEKDLGEMREALAKLENRQ